MSPFPSLGPSARDCRASVAKYLAAQLLTVPYLVYWYDADALQSSANDWWANYRTQQATHLTNPTLQAHLTAAAGLFALVDPPDAIRDWVAEPAVNGVVPPLGTLPIPHAVIDVDPLATGRAYELGTGRFWRERVVSLDAMVRNPLEQDLLADALSVWFPQHAVLPIYDWDSGTGAVKLGELEWTNVHVSLGTDWEDAAAVRHHVAVVLQGTLVV